jgi:hypothetical protein
MSILFGCKYSSFNKIERFENKKDDGDSMLDKFEKNLLEEIKNGKVGSDDINDMIKTNKFTKKNLDNMINYIEKFKGGKLD